MSRCCFTQKFEAPHPDISTKDAVPISAPSGICSPEPCGCHACTLHPTALHRKRRDPSRLNAWGF
jgi:hypothetical protein